MILFRNVFSTSLENFSLQIEKGEFIIINSSDSESLNQIIKLLGAYSLPDKGLLRLPFKRELMKKEMEIVYSEQFFLNDRKVEDNLKYTFQIKEFSLSIFKVRLKKILDLIKINNCLELYPQELKAHQKVRVGIARALLSYPSILILFDSLQYIDEVNSQSIFHLLENINNNNITIIYLSRDSNFCHRHRKIKKVNIDQKKYLEKGLNGNK